MKTQLRFMLKYETLVLVIFFDHVFLVHLENFNRKKLSYFKIDSNMDFYLIHPGTNIFPQMEKLHGIVLTLSIHFIQGNIFQRDEIVSLSSRKHDMHVRFCKCKMSLFLEQKSFSSLLVPRALLKSMTGTWRRNKIMFYWKFSSSTYISFSLKKFWDLIN